MMDTMQSEILAMINRERDRQDAKWGPDRTLSGPFWNLILGEEVGEVAEAMLRKDLADLRSELVQVAAVAVAMIEAIDAGKLQCR
jgi:NTP pyrophosphatase (non-canonical NTP hydrolase)